MQLNNKNKVSVRVDSESIIHADNGLVHIEIDLEKGEFACFRHGLFVLKEIRSAFRWQGREYNTGIYKRHYMYEKPGEIEDSFGKGIHLVIRHESIGLPNVEQHFYVYQDMSYFLTKVVVIHEEETKVNRISVIKTITVTFGNDSAPEQELQVLRVPYDNDKWVRYVAKPLPIEIESYEVAVVYQPSTRQGLILGSITHDTWKTGVRIKGEMAGKLDELELYGGAACEMTRDSQPHGHVKGTRIESPLVFAGFYADYREGLEMYGGANTRIAASLKWEGGVPFGWNSWSAAMSKLDYDLYTSTSDFLKKEVQSLGFQNADTLYINFDAFWDNLTPAEIEDALKRVRQNGHKAGTYWTPFVFWGSPAQFGQTVEGTNGKYTYADLLLRGFDGEILPDIAGGLALDPTHPGTLERIDWFTSKMISEGFEYIKLDFMAHGALEGRHYHPEITTGIAAYNYGLSYLTKRLSPEAAGRPIFINLSIAPLFPYAFAHSRRISCDVFGKIQDTEYLLNSLTHGWWMNNTLYRFNDPDHSVLYKSFNQEMTTRHEGRSRLTASVIAGTVLLLGDDFRNEEAAWRAKAWLQNREVMDLARLGKTFMPVEGNYGDKASDTFVLLHPDDDQIVYLAVFNFDAVQSVAKSVALERAGVDPRQRYVVSDLWEGTESEVQDKLTVHLVPAESKIFKLNKKSD
jgi:alpha-galactosidase